jgi:hypothetical protein
MEPDRSGARDRLLETIYTLTETHSDHPRHPPEIHFTDFRTCNHDIL